MKKLLSVLLTLAALSAALCVPAFAAEAPAEKASEEAAEAPAEKLPPFVRVWGKVSPWDGEGIYLKNEIGRASCRERV